MRPAALCLALLEVHGHLGIGACSITGAGPSRPHVRSGAKRVPLIRHEYRNLSSTCFVCDARPNRLGFGASKLGQDQDQGQGRSGLPVLSPAEQLAHSRLRPILDALPQPVDWAVAYGSGVRHQANADPSGPPPMTDFLLSVPCTTTFHRANLARNPSHYPLSARLLGAGAVGWLTEKWGAGVWYVTMVRIRDLEVKYGVISTARLKGDLERWDTLYVSGRLHKPTLPLIVSPTLSPSLSLNTRSALILSLLLLPAQFSETALWERLAGLSYAGDPRMRVPGAENPDKVRNIVSGQGAREGLRGMYGGFMRGSKGGGGGDSVGEVRGVGVEAGKGEEVDLGLRWVGQGAAGVEEKEAGSEKWDWVGEGEGMLHQPNTVAHNALLLSHLPSTLLSRFIARYHTPSTSSPPVSPSSIIPTTAPIALLQDITTDRIRPLIPPSQPIPAGEPIWKAVLLEELGTIIRRPALTQSAKGLFTAGLRKSSAYAWAKFGKWLHARRTRAAAAAAAGGVKEKSG